MGMREANKKTRIGAVIASVLLGWLLLLPLGTPNLPVRLSYDLLQLFLPESREPKPVLIYMDEHAMEDYHQKPGDWDRSLHARLLDRLSADQARLVVFDVTFTYAGRPRDDQELARAIRRHGRVVLAGDRVPAPVSAIGRGSTLVPPLVQFETNAADWGVAKAVPDPDGVARRYDSGDDQKADLAWAAATVAGAPVTRDPKRRWTEQRWLNYYGSPRPFQSVSMTYTNAEIAEPNFFRGKAVFIGGKPETLSRGDITDVFATPFTKWNSALSPGVDLTAIAYANLMQESWLRRASLWKEMILLLLVGSLSGLLWLQQVRLPRPFGLTLLLAVALAATAIAWVDATFASGPRGGWDWRSFVCSNFSAWYAERSVAAVSHHRRRADASRSRVAAHAGAGLGRTNALEIPGPYADPVASVKAPMGRFVWRATRSGSITPSRSMFRNRFGVEAPYERALRGIQKFMPVSRSHEGFVHILHVGKNDAAGFFFYIMEAGDDQKTGQEIDPLTYVPKTLASELKQRETIPPRECLAIHAGA